VIEALGCYPSYPKYRYNTNSDVRRTKPRKATGYAFGYFSTASEEAFSKVRWVVSGRPYRGMHAGNPTTSVLKADRQTYRRIGELVLRDILANRYVLSGLLGTGGMAEVFLAHDRILGRDLALKVLREHHAKDALFVGRFRTEAQSAAALNHPNVVQVYDQGRSEDGRYYIAMEHVPGGTLMDRIDRTGPLDPGEAARLASQVAEALGAAHERGMVHRDIKPQNVLLDAAGEVKVADFGIALAASSTSISRTNQVFGTARYMSPEQAMAEVVGPQSDLYSLGVVLYEMLTGTAPFEAEGLLATAMKHVTEPPLPPRKRNPMVPEGMDALVMGLLAKNPENRYGSAAELVGDLRRAREGLPLGFAGAAGYSETVRSPAVGAVPAAANTEGGARPGSLLSKPGRRRSIGTGLVALVALLALLGTLGWDLSRTPERVSAVSAIRTPEGGWEGHTLGAPEGLGGARGGGVGKGTGPGTPTADLAGGASVPASASAPASAASASEPRAAAPFSSAPVLGGSSGSGGQDAGAGDPGSGGSPAQEQYK
jgi:tRNA A-37 threonylcarbamoyl transferase component Bud32